MIDFGALLDELEKDKPIFPKEIFESNVRDNRFSYLRGDQEKILEKWFEKREEKDSIIKMNTGGGKTTVGLLQLQSSLNEGIGPSLYLCLDNQLVEQVLREAKELGINCVTFTSGEIPHEFLNCEAVLVTTFSKMFNAKSVFGIEGDVNRPTVEIGCLVIDDAHSALNKAREVFTLKFQANTSVYKELVSIFSESLIGQSIGTAIDILEGRDAFGILMVPYWTWSDRITEVTNLLSKYSSEIEEMKFKWPLVRDYLEYYHVFISGKFLEITPKCLPIQKLPSYHRARRRVFMSATLNDDSALIKDFQVNKKAILKPLESNTFSDIGEKMVLIPHNIDTSLKAENLAAALGKLTGFNIVSIVASNKRAEMWKKNNFLQPSSSDISDVIQKLKTSKGNHIVLSNRYDGIDLSDSSCRILIIDDLPTATSLFEQYCLYARPGSKIMRINQAQKIEQGLGRAVRSVNDYAVVLLCGTNLVSIISTNEFQKLMSPQTVTQIKLGKSVADLVKQAEEKSPLKQLGGIMAQVLRRDPQWVKLHKQQITKTVRPVAYNNLIELAEKERKAFDLAIAHQTIKAAEEIRSFINSDDDFAKDDVGWYLQLAASYLYKGDRAKAMELQLSAHSRNPYLLRPPSGINYVKLTKKQTLQAIRIKVFLENFTDSNAIILFVNNILEDIAFKPDSATKFENAFANLGKCLGFETQQPEREFGLGCDILWNIYDDEFLVIEAKNEVKLSRETIYKLESEQISNSINWFNQEYTQKIGIPLLIHPSNKLHREAFTPENTHVLNEYNLNIFKNNIRDLFAKLSQREPGNWSPEEIVVHLRDYKLERKQIKNYFVPVDRN
ncbi:DEAD/DEAH box helicase family protein [Bacillus pretiosus]|uniref:DEAD/DEAH box helicase family protein n=1 Tax=Bacillus pretiosus TaxID=2983392 RepID=UPI003D3028AD